MLIAAVTAFVYWPTLDNGFLSLSFDDAIILDNPAIREITSTSMSAMATEFVHAHYVPVTMLSLAIDYRFWHFEPRGYHLTNVLLHTATAMLAAIFLWSIMPSIRSATFAALIFALHPVQMEAVSLAIQRKTLLSAAGFFLTLILYRRWRNNRRGAYYAAALLVFAAAALAKPAVISLPVVLLLYEYAFIDGRLRLLDKLPFAIIAAAVAAAAVAAHAELGVLHAPHGGKLVVHVMMVARVGLEYLAAALFPANLSPIYYYPREMAYAPLNVLAPAVVVLVGLYVTVRRRRFAWTFFCLAWFVLTLLPESNIVPLAQLRADRFLYLPILGVGIWLAVGLERMPALPSLGRLRRLPAYVLGIAVVAAFALITRDSAAIWRSDVSAWTRVAQRHPWCATAHMMLGRSLAGSGETALAESAYRTALQRDPQQPNTYLELARLYHYSGRWGAADAALHRFVELEPEDPRGLALLEEMRAGGARRVEN